MHASRATSRAQTIDVEDLARELEEYRSVIDSWVDENIQRARALRDRHARALAKLEREYDSLCARERELSAKAHENQMQCERAEVDAERAREATEMAKALAEGLPEQLAALRAKTESDRRNVRAMRDAQSASSANAKLEALKHASETYGARLGLRFAYGEEEKLALKFKYIDERAPDREFTFGVRLDGSTYEVVECEPEVDEIYTLVRECNRTNDFGKFVRDARRAFVAHCAAQRRARR